MSTATRFLGLLAIAMCGTAEAVAQRPSAQPAKPSDPVVVIREAFRRHRSHEVSRALNPEHH